MKIKENKRGNGLLISNSEYKLIRNVISFVNKNNRKEEEEEKEKEKEKEKDKKINLSFIPASKLK